MTDEQRDAGFYDCRVKPTPLTDDVSYIPGYLIFDEKLSEEQVAEMQQVLKKHFDKPYKFHSSIVVGDGKTEIEPLSSYNITFRFADFCIGFGTGCFVTLLIAVILGSG